MAAGVAEPDGAGVAEPEGAGVAEPVAGGVGVGAPAPPIEMFHLSSLENCGSLELNSRLSGIFGSLLSRSTSRYADGSPLTAFMVKLRVTRLV